MSMSSHESLLALPGRWRDVDADAPLFRRSEKVNTLYLLDTGEVHLSRTTTAGDVIVMQRCTAGMVIAAASLFSSTYHCDAHAATSARVYGIARQTLRRHLSQSEDRLLDWCASLSREVQSLRMQNEILRLRTVAGRLDAWLSWQDKPLPAKGSWLSIARDIGVSPEALYREIARRR